MVDSHKMSNHFKSNKINVDNIRNYLTEFEKNHENSGDKYPLKSLDFYDFLYLPYTFGVNGIYEFWIS